MWIKWFWLIQIIYQYETYILQVVQLIKFAKIFTLILFEENYHYPKA